jgi:hypothetical protein
LAAVMVASVAFAFVVTGTPVGPVLHAFGIA